MIKHIRNQQENRKALQQRPKDWKLSGSAGLAFSLPALPNINSTISKEDDKAKFARRAKPKAQHISAVRRRFYNNYFGLYLSF